MISENFYDGDEVSQGDDVSQGDAVSQGDSVSQEDSVSQSRNTSANVESSQPEEVLANTVDEISQKIQHTAKKAYNELPEPKTKSWGHWIQVTSLFILKIILSIIALKLAWSCNSNASSNFLRIIYTFISTLFSEIYIIYYAIWRIFLGNSCSPVSNYSSAY